MAAAVLFDLERLTLSDRRALSKLNDSKQHTAEGREDLYPLVMRAAARSVIVTRCVRGIDARGLHNTNLEALRTALLGVAREGSICLVDGSGTVPAFGFEQRAVIDGDCRSAAIAAASVLAKVSRDRYMRRAAELHPGWDFETNVGYLHRTTERRSARTASRPSIACRSSRSPTAARARGLARLGPGGPRRAAAHPASGGLGLRRLGSEGSLHMVELQDPAGRVEHDPDRVEPDLGRRGPEARWP